MRQPYDWLLRHKLPVRLDSTPCDRLCPAVEGAVRVTHRPLVALPASSAPMTPGPVVVQALRDPLAAHGKLHQGLVSSSGLARRHLRPTPKPRLGCMFAGVCQGRGQEPRFCTASTPRS